MSHAGLIAFALAAAFCGAAVYISLVEQPARLSLDDKAMVAEWMPSDRRGMALFGGLALVTAGFGLSAYALSGDVRWLMGTLIIVASWPYMFFVMVPLNNRLLASSAEAGPDARAFVTDWGLVEWGLGIIGLMSTIVFGWALW